MFGVAQGHLATEGYFRETQSPKTGSLPEYMLIFHTALKCND